MLKHCLPHLLLISVLFPISLPIQAAQISEGTSTKCARQIEATEQRLLEIKDLSLVEAGTEEYSESEPDRPLYATHSAYFIVEQSGGSNLMHSPVLMKSIATDIFAKCDAAGSVIFTFNNSDWVEIYGKFTDGSVKSFKCAEDLTTIPWGTQPCL